MLLAPGFIFLSVTLLSPFQALPPQQPNQFTAQEGLGGLNPDALAMGKELNICQSACGTG